jgi:hypothetical protein
MSLGVDDFVASNGWLYKWMQRRNVHQSCLRDLLVSIFNTRSFPSLQAAYMVQTWQKVAVSENELPKKIFTGLGIMQTEL